MIETKQDVEDIKKIIREVIKEEHGVYKRIQLRLNNDAFSEDRD